MDSGKGTKARDEKMVPLLGSWHREKNRKKEHSRDVLLGVPFFLMPSYFHMTFGCPSDLRALSFVWTTTETTTQYRQYGLCSDFINLGKSVLLMICISTKALGSGCLLCPDLSSSLYMMVQNLPSSFPTWKEFH